MEWYDIWLESYGDDKIARSLWYPVKIAAMGGATPEWALGLGLGFNLLIGATILGSIGLVGLAIHEVFAAGKEK